MTASILLVTAAILTAVIVGLVLGGWAAHRRAQRPVEACDFPGCIAARVQLRRAAAEYDAIPPEVVLAIVDGVETHEHTSHSGGTA